MDAPTLSADYQRDWPAYFEAVRGQPARDTCLAALDAFEAEDRLARERPVARLALDIAAGEGRDTRAMLSRDGSTRWHVVALDLPPAVALLRSTLDADARARCTTIAGTMEAFAAEQLLPGVGACFDLVNASFALPFCREDAFPALWSRVRGLLAPGGRFAGQLFGDRDEWARVNPRRHVTRERALELLAGLGLERFEEVEKDGSDAMQRVKHHHLFHVVARRA
jgi:SAM-dependent methyltransferase